MSYGQDDDVNIGSIEILASTGRTKLGDHFTQERGDGLAVPGIGHSDSQATGVFQQRGTRNDTKMAGIECQDRQDLALTQADADIQEQNISMGKPTASRFGWRSAAHSDQ